MADSREWSWEKMLAFRDLCEKITNMEKGDQHQFLRALITVGKGRAGEDMDLSDDFHRAIELVEVHQE